MSAENRDEETTETLHFYRRRSRRKGKPSDDPEIIERRLFYSNIQDKLRRDHKENEQERLKLIIMSKEERHMLEKEQIMKEKVENSTTIKEFKSSVIAMAEEIAAKQNSAVECALNKEHNDTNKAGVYKRDANFDCKKWITILYKPKETFKYNPETQIKRKVIILCPGLACGPNFFRDWIRHFLYSDNNIEIYGICLPGKMNRIGETVPRLMLPIIGAIVDSLCELEIIQKSASLPTETSLTLFGHSLGALILFDMSRYLLFKGYETVVSNLIVSACPGPEKIREYNIDKFTKKFSLESKGDLVNQMLVLDLAPEELRERKEVLSLYVTYLRADYYLLENYKFIKWESERVPALSCKLLILGAEDDLSCNLGDIKSWRDQSSNPQILQYIFNTGGHSYLKYSFYFTQIIEAIRCMINDTIPKFTLEIEEE